MALSKAKHIHIIGIGGVGLSALARVLLGRGYQVSGSDLTSGPLTSRLERDGAQIYIGHKAAHLAPDVDLILVTSAVREDNAEVLAAHDRGIPVLHRREFLTELRIGYRTIAVAGSHGKTTTATLIGLLLAAGGLDPTAIVGGLVPQWGSNARIGRSEFLVIEADEYDRAFLGLEPDLAVVTNVDYDHPDIYPTRHDYQEVFREFIERTSEDGVIIVCGDDATASRLAVKMDRAVVRYGLGQQNDWVASNIICRNAQETEFEVFNESRRVGNVALRIPGEHNVRNALAALAVASRLGVPFETAARALEGFTGVGRRFELKGDVGGVTILDDYAHHPAEIKATLSAARQRFDGSPIWAVFQPHTFSRTRALLDEFAGAFGDADHVVVTEIYASREANDPGVSGRDIVERMRHPDARFVPTLDGATDIIKAEITSGSVLITLGAGNVNRLGEQLLEIENGPSLRT